MPVTVDQLTALAVACVVLIAIPGPSVLFVIGRALSHGRTAALASVLGNGVGCYLVGVGIAVGLGPLLQRSELLFQTIKWAGVLYLVWLGVQAMRHARPLPVADITVTGSGHPWAAARTGVIVGLTNPKSFVMFTAIVPQFVDPARGSTAAQILVLGLAPFAVGLVTDTVWALTAGRARTWLARSPGRMTAIGRAGGLAVIGVGVSVAATGGRP